MSVRTARFELDAYDIARLIRDLASDPAEVAAIIKKAGDEIKERSDEEDRG
jgi:hypothetical protein